jgi:hypothetical protein
MAAAAKKPAAPAVTAPEQPTASAQAAGPMFTVNLDPGVISVILKGLRKLPYEESSGIIQGLEGMLHEGAAQFVKDQANAKADAAVNKAATDLSNEMKRRRAALAAKRK